jgi:hypothetical protein
MLPSQYNTLIPLIFYTDKPLFSPAPPLPAKSSLPKPTLAPYKTPQRAEYSPLLMLWILITNNVNVFPPLPPHTLTPIT